MPPSGGRGGCGRGRYPCNLRNSTLWRLRRKGERVRGGAARGGSPGFFTFGAVLFGVDVAGGESAVWRRALGPAGGGRWDPLAAGVRTAGGVVGTRVGCGVSAASASAPPPTLLRTIWTEFGSHDDHFVQFVLNSDDRIPSRLLALAPSDIPPPLFSSLSLPLLPLPRSLAESENLVFADLGKRGVWFSKTAKERGGGGEAGAEEGQGGGGDGWGGRQGPSYRPYFATACRMRAPHGTQIAARNPTVAAPCRQSHGMPAAYAATTVGQVMGST
jgi:hypothetical protein